MKRVIPIILLLIILGAGYWWFSQGATSATPPATMLAGSGSIEAETVAITAELGGRVLAVKAAEGDEVTAGQVLVELDRTDLLAQKTQLEAALAAAEANLALVSAPARAEDVTAAQAQLNQAQVAQTGAELIWQRATALASDPHELAARITQGQTRLTEAAQQLELAQVQLKRAEIQAESASRNQSNHEALVQQEVAQHQLQAAQVRVKMAELALAGAKRQVEHLVQMRNRPLALIAQANTAEASYHQAEAAVLAAEATLAAVEAGPWVKDVAVAQAQVLEAEAALAAINVQLAKQTLIAPRAGLIRHKLINPGELAEPGAVLLELSDIETVDLVVYLPETQIGRVKIGQKARVEVDAYPGQAFEGRVSFIAHEAEFTPRNVQTEEERVNLVFAVKITLANADHRLKPGMPADARILPEFELVAVSPTTIRTTPATSLPMPTATPRPAMPTAEPTRRLATATPAAQVEVIAWGLNVRRGPGMDQPVIASLSRGDTVPLVETDARPGWLQIELPGGNTGWIAANPAYVVIK